MGVSFSSNNNPALSPEELAKVRKYRADLTELLRTAEGELPRLVDQKTIDTDAAREAQQEMRSMRTFLAKNVNLNYDQLQAEVQIRAEKSYKKFLQFVGNRQFRNWGTVLIQLADNLYADKKIDFKQSKALKSEATALLQWVAKNGKTAEGTDYKDREDDLFRKIKEIIKNEQLYNMIKFSLDRLRTIDTKQLDQYLSEKNKLQARLAKDADINELTEYFTSAMSSTVFNLLFIVICLLSGCLAANMAIGRTPAYRVLYFIYGAFPLFIPFVFMYAIYTRLTTGALRIYTMLPISIDPATSRLGKVLWHPFYWMPDQKSIDSYKAFTTALENAVA